jgi:hypothetical protein
MRATMADQKHAPNTAAVGRILRAEIDRKQVCQSRLAVPCQPVEIIVYRVETTFVCAEIKRLVHDVFANPVNSQDLQTLLNDTRECPGRC